jgi:hypothetical protein
VPSTTEEVVMSEYEREDEPNETQRRMDEEGTSDRPADVDWEETEASPHEGEEGQQPA